MNWRMALNIAVFHFTALNISQLLNQTGCRRNEAPAAQFSQLFSYTFATISSQVPFFPLLFFPFFLSLYSPCAVPGLELGPWCVRFRLPSFFFKFFLKTCYCPAIVRVNILALLVCHWYYCFSPVSSSVFNVVLNCSRWIGCHVNITFFDLYVW